MSNSPRITVSMMVKNEEELLPQALESIKDFADEIVVVDTGSEDRTVEIAESFGAKVYHHPWENNFAKHRNQTIDYATGEWIFILDADEQLDKEGVTLLKQAAEREDLNIIAIPVISVIEAADKGSAHNSIRMFRSNLGIRYEGSVHNEIVYSGEVSFIPAKLYHYGYDLSREKMIAKFHRTTELLFSEMEKDPSNPKWPHYLAVSHHTEGLMSDALQFALKSIENCGDDVEKKEDWIDNYYLASTCYLSLEDSDSSEEYIDKALDIYQDYIDAWAVKTSIYFRRGDSEKLKQSAEKYFELREHYQKKPGDFKTIALHTLNEMYLILVRLAMDARRNGDMENFEIYFQKAKAATESPHEVVDSLASYLARTGETEAAIEILESHLSEFKGNNLLTERLVKLLIRSKRFDQARMVVEVAVQSGLSENEGQFLFGLIHLLSGDYNSACDTFGKLVENDPDNVDAKINLGMTLEKLDRIDEAEKAYLEAIDLAPEKLESAINLGQLYARYKKLPEAIAFLEQVTLADDNLYDVHLLLARLYWDVDDVDKMVSRAVHVGRKLKVEIKDTLESAADLAEIFNQIGLKLISMKIFKAATVSLEMAKNLGPDNWEIHYNFGNSLLLTNDTPKALQAFEQSARLAPDRWEVFEGLGRCYQAMGSKEAVLMCEKKVEELKNK